MSAEDVLFNMGLKDVGGIIRPIIGLDYIDKPVDIYVYDRDDNPHLTKVTPNLHMMGTLEYFVYNFKNQMLSIKLKSANGADTFDLEDVHVEISLQTKVDILGRS